MFSSCCAYKRKSSSTSSPSDSVSDGAADEVNYPEVVIDEPIEKCTGDIRNIDTEYESNSFEDNQNIVIEDKNGSSDIEISVDMVVEEISVSTRNDSFTPNVTTIDTNDYQTSNGIEHKSSSEDILVIEQYECSTRDDEEDDSTSKLNGNMTDQQASELLPSDSVKSSIEDDLIEQQQRTSDQTGEYSELPPPPVGYDDVDDEVFSDSIPAKMPTGNMCTPFPKKKNSLPGVFALPEWFYEKSGMVEPPVTPIGRDELALKRHRFLSDLIQAVQSASDHRVRFDPFGPQVATDDGSDCDPLGKKTTLNEFQNLCNRLEILVNRLERAVSAQNLEIVENAFQTVRTQPPPPPPPEELEDIVKDIVLLNQSSEPKEGIQDLSDDLPSPPTPLEELSYETNNNYYLNLEEDPNIPVVVEQIFLRDNSLQNDSESESFPTIISNKDYVPSSVANMSVNGFEDILLGPLNDYFTLSQKIGGDVATHASMVQQAFKTQFQFIQMAAASAQPSADQQQNLLKPTSQCIEQIQSFREKNRTSQFFNHLSAISESVPALGWVCVSPTPGPYVKEMNDAGQFYTNRVLKDWKEKDTKHVEWARSWVQTLTQLQQYIKQWHTTGLVWSGKTIAVAPAGSAPPPPPPGCPPPPPVMPMAELSLAGGNDDRSALFAQINQGEDITKSLKKVTSDMQTHKNPQLRTGPAPFVTPQPFKAPGAAPNVRSQAAAPVAKPPVFSRDGKKWIIEYQKGNTGLLVENAEMNNVVYMFRCENSTLTVKGKINSVVMDSCKKCSILFDSVVSSIEFVNCQSVQMQVLGKCPTISIDKTDGCQMYLSADSLDVEVISSKSSEMNVLIPKGASGDYIEQPIPEQFKTTIAGNRLNTICVESLG